MLLHHYNVFDSDAEFTVVVVAWLVRDTHTGLKFEFIGSGNAYGSFVDVEHGANAVASAMFIVQAHLEEVSAGKDVEVCPA